MKYFTREQIEKILQVSHSTVQKWYMSGLPREKRIGVTNRFKFHTKQTALESFIGRELSEDEIERAGEVIDV